MRTMNIIGAGKVARVLARLWHETGQFEVRQILNRSLASGREAIEFMGCGEAMSGWDRMKPVDAWLIGTPDDAIWSSAQHLADNRSLQPGQIVFHLSGARDASSLTLVKEKGALVASLHPLKSFPDALRVYRSFDPTWCALEGQDQAVAVLEEVLQAIGARTVRLEAGQKLAYHAGSALLSNYLVALMDTGLEVYEQAGIPRETGRQMILPLMRETLINAMEMGPGEALTGPVVRGDVDIVRSHLTHLSPSQQRLYRALALKTLELARSAHRLDEAKAGPLEELLEQLAG